MAEPAGCRKKSATNQNDLTGPALILNSKQARPSSADVPQFPVPTLQADDPSQRTMATGPADPPQRDDPVPTRPARFARHAFKLELFYRNVEDSDERFDRGARKRQDLLSNDEETYSSIYRARHAQRKVDSATDWVSMGLGEDDNDLRRQEQECTSSAAYRSGCDRSGENRRVAELKTLEQDLVAMSDGKLNPKMPDIRPSSSMTEDDRERWDEIAAQLVVEMSDTSMTLGQLVNRISTIHSGKDGEDRLISEFEAFANSIATRVAEACGEVDRTSSGLFKSSATHEVESEQTPRVGSGEEQTDKKFDIIIHGDHAEHVDDMSWGLHHSFGALRVEPWKDLGDILLGQMLRYVRKFLQNRPVTGRSVAFSLCGYLFRLLETNPAGFSTSASFDFRNPNDHIKIITSIAYLAGMSFKVSQQWEPSPNQSITVRREDHQDVHYRLGGIERLAFSPTIWGRRTAVWSAQAVPLDGPSSEDAIDSRGLPMIIKSTWFPKQCYTHELDICEVIDKARKACLAKDPASSIPNLPIPVGQIVNRISDFEISLDSWKTPDGGWQLSTLATFCEIGRHVDETPITVANHIQLHASLARALKWLAEAGIHYRDLNNGNVLRSKNGNVVLIDFGNSRYLKRPRGQKGDIGPLELSLDDAHSGTLMFMSRRIHALTNEARAYQQSKEQMEATRKTLIEAGRTEFYQVDKDQLEGQQIDLQELGETLAERARQHCYVDDSEAQVLLMTQQMLYTTNNPQLFREMENLLVKEAFWGARWVNLRGVETNNEDWKVFVAAINAWRKSIDRCHKALAVASTVSDDGRLTPHERQCFDEVIDILETMGRSEQGE